MNNWLVSSIPLIHARFINTTRSSSFNEKTDPNFSFFCQAQWEKETEATYRVNKWVEDCRSGFQSMPEPRTLPSWRRDTSKEQDEEKFQNHEWIHCPDWARHLFQPIILWTPSCAWKERLELVTAFGLSAFRFCRAVQALHIWILAFNSRLQMASNCLSWMTVLKNNWSSLFNAMRQLLQKRGEMWYFYLRTFSCNLDLPFRCAKQITTEHWHQKVGDAHSQTYQRKGGQNRRLQVPNNSANQRRLEVYEHPN